MAYIHNAPDQTMTPFRRLLLGQKQLRLPLEANTPMSLANSQADMFEDEASRSLLDQLLEDSRLYTTSENYLNLLEFTKRLRNFARSMAVCCISLCGQAA